MTTKVDADVDLGKIEADIDLGLDDINAKVDLGKIEADVGLDDIRANAKVDLDVGKIEADVGAKVQADADLKGNIVAAIKELAPLLLQFAWKEVPLVRVGVPHRYKVGFNLLGHEIASITLCGESELVTESTRCDDQEKKR